MPLSMLAAFGLVSMLFVIIPGADWAYAISAGMERAALPAISGLLMGHLLATVLVATGVGAIVANAPVIMQGLTILGTSYLLWLGASMLLSPPVPAVKQANGRSASWFSWSAKGFCVSGLNPKVFLLFLALLPTFVTPSAKWPLALQMMVLGLVHVANCAAIYTIVTLASRKLLESRPRAANAIGRLSGAMMVALAIALLIEKFF